MRKWILAGAGVGMLALLVVVLLTARGGVRAAAREKGEDGPRLTQLPIGQVVLYSSGVGYFQREGAVEGDARVDLSFPTGDINDLLKSLVLRDLDGGHVSAVSYDANAPLERTLRSFAVNLTGNPGFAELLNQARGEKVEVALAQAAAGSAATLSGTIIGVEKQRQAIGKDQAIEVAVLNLWCSDGMRAVKLSEVQRVRLLSSLMDTEFKKALETLAAAHDTQKKAVSIRFAGEGKRRVRVGYVVENPIWKTSYRLVLPTAKADKPYLQGWAVVDNPSDEDWKDVRMALISGRPISFQMDLYTPLFVQRPTVVPDLFQSLRPVAYSGALDMPKPDSAAAAPLPAPAEPGMPGRPPVVTGGVALGLGGFGGARGREGKETYRRGLAEDLKANLQLGQSVASAASAAQLGDYFQYAIDRPVSLPRQKSALLPIVGKDVQATRVSIYNEATQARFPLLGLRFKNTSGLHLMQGPITVFEGSTYAGDARVLDLQPGEERLLSYAIDLGTEVNAVPSAESGRILAVKAVKGIIHTTIKNRQIKTYTVKNRNEAERTVLIEHPARHDFKLVEAKPSETAADVYRFELKVPAGASKTQVVTQEREDAHRYAISSQSDEQIRFLLSQPVMSPKLKDGLKRAQELRWEVEKVRRELREQERQLKTITDDQGRLRANLREMPSTAQAYKRYLEKFDQQETQIEKFQADIKTLQQQEHAKQKAFEDFLAAFSAE